MKLPFLQKRQKANNIDPSWAALASPASSVFTPSVEVANSLSAVQACVSAISGTIASLPVRGGAPWIKRPNDAQSWADFAGHMLRSVLLYGNAIALLEEDQLIPVPWQSVRVERLKTHRLRYTIRVNHGLYDIRATDSVVRLSTGVVHIRDASNDGIVGVSRLSRCAPVVNGVLTLEEAARNVFTNGAFPSGVVTLPQSLKPDGQKAAMRQLQETFGGTDNRAKLAVLTGGGEWKPSGTKPRDAEMLESRLYSLQEICRLFDVPPVIAGDHSNATYTNAETAIRLFAITTLSTWVKKFEEAVEHGTGTPINIDMSGLLRGDPATRWSNHKIAIESGVYTPAEVKAMEGEIS